ncbi:hypothetical protein LAD67_06030 [Escherichia coli]|nr:hypothetical protein [Escherichia coli]
MLIPTTGMVVSGAGERDCWGNCALALMKGFRDACRLMRYPDCRQLDWRFCVLRQLTVGRFNEGALPGWR